MPGRGVGLAQTCFHINIIIYKDMAITINSYHKAKQINKDAESSRAQARIVL